MSRGNAPFSAVDEAAIKAIAAANKVTNDALAELTRAIAAQPDRPQRQNRSYRLTNMTHGADGEMTGDMEYSDGRVRRFRFARGDDGEIDGEIEDIDPVGPAVDAGPASETAPGGLADIFGSIEADHG
jgi:hypothetical protein